MTAAYHRPIDGALMVEVAPHQFVNSISAAAFGLVAPGVKFEVVADAPKPVPQSRVGEMPDDAFARGTAWRL